MSLSTVSITRRCIAQETFCEFVLVINVTIIIIIIYSGCIQKGGVATVIPVSIIVVWQTPRKCRTRKHRTGVATATPVFDEMGFKILFALRAIIFKFYHFFATPVSNRFRRRSLCET